MAGWGRGWVMWGERGDPTELREAQVSEAGWLGGDDGTPGQELETERVDLKSCHH